MKKLTNNNAKINNVYSLSQEFDRIIKIINSYNYCHNSNFEKLIRLNKDELNFFNFLKSEEISKEEKIIKITSLNKENKLINIIKTNFNFNHLSEENKKNLYNDFEMFLKDLKFFLKTENIKIDDLKLINKNKTYSTLNIVQEKEDVIKTIDGNWCYKIKEKSYEEIKSVIDILLETEPAKLIKLLTKNNYGLNPLTSALLNNDQKVFEYLINVYKKLSINLKDYTYISENKSIKIKSKNYYLIEKQSHYDLALSLNKIKIAKILENNNMNESQLHPLEMGGLFDNLYGLDFKEKDFINQLINYAIEEYGIDYILCNFNNKYLNNYEIMHNFNIQKNDFSFLSYNKEIFSTEEYQKKYYNFIISNIECTINEFEVAKSNSFMNVNYYVNKLGLILDCFFKNFTFIESNNILSAKELKSFIEYLENFDNEKKYHENFKGVINKAINENNFKIRYEKNLLNNTVVNKEKKPKEKTKFKI